MKMSNFLQASDFSTIVANQNIHTWSDNAYIIEDILKNEFGEKVISSLYLTSAEDVLKNFLLANAWNFNELYKIIGLTAGDDYEILDNVNEITDEETYLGERKTVTTGGEWKNTDTGTETNTSTNYTVPYESTTETETGKSVDTRSLGNGMVSESDRLTDDQVTSSMKSDDPDTFSRRRHGNIGVTTSGQLMRDFEDSHKWNFYYHVAREIVLKLCTREWEFDD
ncbi:MAG: hypothetical protein J6S67_16415 [Methanobrevibacter sp.]|nr:hypothetical protein [Methanobrevibacter sp.]